MAQRVAASSQSAAELQQVTSASVALQEEAQSVRERKLALEETMRQERNQRLRTAAVAAAAPKPTTSPHAAAHVGRPRSAKPAEKSGVLRGGSASARASASSHAQTSTALPSQDLHEYRRELDDANGNKEVFRLHHYTNAHLNPADVEFHTAKGRVRVFQRHAPSPPRSAPRSRTPPNRRTRLAVEPSQLLADVAAPPPLSADSTSEQWTKSAVLRLQANQRVLQRIHAKESEEATFAARRVPSRHASVPRSQTVGVSQRSYPPTTLSQEHNPAAVPARVAAATQAGLPVAGGPALAPPPPLSSTAFTDGVARAERVAPTAARWSSRQQRSSPTRRGSSTSPVRLFAGSSASRSPLLSGNSPFKPSLTYASASSSSLHASRTDAFPAHSSSGAFSHERPAPGAWRTLQDSWVPFTSSRTTAPTTNTDYQPIAQQPSAAAASGTAWQSRRTWEELTRRSSPFRLHTEAKPLPTPHASGGSSRADDAKAAAAQEKPAVDVSPLTPSPTMKTAPRSGGSERDGVVRQPSVEGDAVAPGPKASLLEGFRMPETVLKRDDLFHGSS